VPAWHLYVIRHERPDALALHLKARGIASRGYYREPIDAQAAMSGYPRTVALPWTDLVAAEHLAIPISAAITEQQIGTVAEAIKSFG
jgi:dTDP-4-amino-4,6-dideoxygalactose transaminase